METSTSKVVLSKADLITLLFLNSSIMMTSRLSHHIRPIMSGSLGSGMPRLPVSAVHAHAVSRIAEGSCDHAKIDTCIAGDLEWTAQRRCDRPEGRLSFNCTDALSVFKAP